MGTAIMIGIFAKVFEFLSKHVWLCFVLPFVPLLLVAYSSSRKARQRQEMLQRIEEREHKKEQEYREREKAMDEHRRFVAEQRRLMTDKLRYQVLARDNFRCQICGATAKDGVKLHVDHIYPVSKGGKTELSNLQTLCERCNMGKSDRVA